MSALVIFAYARAPHAKFDHEYYVNSHMPLAQKTWAKHGMRSWEAFRMADDAPNVVEAITYWDSLEGFEKALGEEGTKEVMADVKNYTNLSVAILKGSKEGSGSA